MTQPLEQRRYTVEEYLELESASEEKHEFLDGQIIHLSQILAMAGGAEWHSLIAMNMGREIGIRLKGQPCRVYGSDFRIRIPRKTVYAYPDVSVICGKTDLDPDTRGGHTALNPKLIVEVLSPSTEGYDRGEKFARYREIPSFEEYVLVSQVTPLIETFLRQGDGSWAFNVFTGLQSIVKLRSLQIELPLSDAYADVTFPPDVDGA